MKGNNALQTKIEAKDYHENMKSKNIIMVDCKRWQSLLQFTSLELCSVRIYNPYGSFLKEISPQFKIITIRIVRDYGI